MRVLMISRATLFSTPGGDTIQICNTAKYLRLLGVHVDIKLTDDPAIDYRKYDLLHLFNVIRPNDLLVHVRKSELPYVLSTIYVDYSEFEKTNRKGPAGMVARATNKYAVEYLKIISRAVFNGERIASKEYLVKGHKRSIKKLLTEAVVLLPNSNSEMRRLENDFNVTNQYAIVPNAIDSETFYVPSETTERRGVVCVARIEGRKNQLRLIESMQGIDLPLTIVGNASPNHQHYFDACRAAAGANVTFISHTTQLELAAIYASARVHVLPSWFETTGLSSLEAGYTGCNVVVTKKGDTEEYFKDMVTYCDPGSVSSIRQAVLAAHEKPLSQVLHQHIKDNYTWEAAAKGTLAAYKTVFKNKL